jgi:hypothetical protein
MAKSMNQRVNKNDSTSASAFSITKTGAFMSVFPSGFHHQFPCLNNSVQARKRKQSSRQHDNS